MRNRKLGVSLAGLLAATLALTACGSSSDDDTADTSDGLLSSVDTMFGTIDVPEPEDGDLTVVALGWSDAETALALGVKPVAVYDWLGFGADGKAVGPWATDLYGDVDPAIIKDVGEEVNYEQIQALDPDLILNTRAGNDEKQFKRLNDIAPTIYAPEGTPAYGTKWRVQTQLVADALGQSDDGKKLIADVEKQIADAAEAHPEFEGKTAVSSTKFGEAYGAYVAGDARWDLIEELGFVQNPAVLDLKPNGFYVDVSVEQIEVLDADVTVLFPIGYTLKDVEDDKLIASLDSVKDGRAVFLGESRGDSTDENTDLSQAFSATSILSIPVAVKGIVPLLADAAAKL